MSDEYRGYYVVRNELRESNNVNERRIAAIVDTMSYWRGFRYMTDEMDEDDVEEFFNALKTAINSVEG